MKRVPLIAGNWKMNKLPEESAELAAAIKAALAGQQAVEAVLSSGSLFIFQLPAMMGTLFNVVPSALIHNCPHQLARAQILTRSLHHSLKQCAPKH